MVRKKEIEMSAKMVIFKNAETTISESAYLGYIVMTCKDYGFVSSLDISCFRSLNEDGIAHFFQDGA